DLTVTGVQTCALPNLIEVVEPATESVMATVESADLEQTDAAVAAAKAAFPAWRALTPSDRASLLHRLADELSLALDELAVLEARSEERRVGEERRARG